MNQYHARHNVSLGTHLLLTVERALDFGILCAESTLGEVLLVREFPSLNVSNLEVLDEVNFINIPSQHMKDLQRGNHLEARLIARHSRGLALYADFVRLID
jgi:hypothetical protein